MGKPLYVSGTIRVTEGNIEELKPLLQEFAANTVKLEPGCISYEFLQDIGNQAIFASRELWQNEEAEAAHWKTPHLLEFSEKLSKLTEWGPLTRYTRV